jgi:hypothetical protein
MPYNAEVKRRAAFSRVRLDEMLGAVNSAPFGSLNLSQVKSAKSDAGGTDCVEDDLFAAKIRASNKDASRSYEHASASYG